MCVCVFMSHLFISMMLCDNLMDGRTWKLAWNNLKTWTSRIEVVSVRTSTYGPMISYEYAGFWCEWHGLLGTEMSEVHPNATCHRVLSSSKSHPPCRTDPLVEIPGARASAHLGSRSWELPEISRNKIKQGTFQQIPQLNHLNPIGLVMICSYPCDLLEQVAVATDRLRVLDHGSLNVPIEHHPTIRYMVYNGFYKVMSNIPKMGHLPTPVDITCLQIQMRQASSCHLVALSLRIAVPPRASLWDWGATKCAPSLVAAAALGPKSLLESRAGEIINHYDLWWLIWW